MQLIPSVKNLIKNLTASKLVVTDASKVLQSENVPLIVGKGGSGLATIAAGSYLKGNNANNLVPRTPGEVKVDLGINPLPGTEGGTGKATMTTDSFLVGAAGNTYIEKTIANVKTMLALAISYASQYPPAHDDAHVKATSVYDATRKPYFVTNPALSLIGSVVDNGWTANGAQNITNQRFHIDLGTAKNISHIYYENYHVTGGSTNGGAKDFTLWGSNAAGDFADLVYANDGTWKQLQTSIATLLQHVASDVSDPCSFNVFYLIPYRYYAFKFANNYGNANDLGLRRIELQNLIVS